MTAAMRAVRGKVVGMIATGLRALSGQPGDNNTEYRFTY
jgi:hypothetical protein